METGELKAVRQQKGATVGKDSNEGGSAREQNQKDMEDKIKSSEGEIEGLAEEATEWSNKVSPPSEFDDVEMQHKLRKSIFKRALENRLKEEEDLKEKGDTGPSL